MNKKTSEADCATCIRATTGHPQSKTALGRDSSFLPRGRPLRQMCRNFANFQQHQKPQGDADLNADTLEMTWHCYMATGPEGAERLPIPRKGQEFRGGIREGTLKGSPVSADARSDTRASRRARRDARRVHPRLTATRRPKTIWSWASSSWVFSGLFPASHEHSIPTLRTTAIPLQ
jgi:hypothetical protein